MQGASEPVTAAAPASPGGPAPVDPRRDDRPPPGRRRRWHRSAIAVLVVAIVVAAVLRAPTAVREFTRAFTHIRAGRLPWLAVAVAAEVVSFVCYALLQRALLRAGPGRVRLRVLLRLSVASSGLRALLPVGVVPSSGWLLGEYRRIGVSSPTGLYAVLASGFVSTVALLGLLLVGSGIGGIGQPVVLLASGIVLVAGSAGFVALVHHLGALQRIERACHGRLGAIVSRLVETATEVGHLRVGARAGTSAFASAAGNWLADLVCLVAAFALLGMSAPWRGVLFAYTASQLAGSLVPLPGGLGAVEGGMVGAFALLGVSVGAALAVAIVYRVVTYWGVAILGGVELAILSRRPPGPGDLLEDHRRP